MERMEQALGGPEVEVAAKATRRRFTAEYKRRILQEADACTKPGEVGALLRREGLYSSHLTAWRAARERGELAGAPKKRGPARRVVDPRDKQIAELERRDQPVAEARRAGRGAGGAPKKSGGAAGNAAGRAETLLMATVTPDRAAARRRADVRGARAAAGDLLPAAAARAGPRRRGGGRPGRSARGGARGGARPCCTSRGSWTWPRRGLRHAAR